MKLFNSSAIDDIKTDKSGKLVLRNLALTDVPMQYGESWEHIPQEEMALCYKDWVGVPVFISQERTPDHPDGISSAENVRNNVPDGAVISAELTQAGIVLTMSLFDGERSGSYIEQGAAYTSTAYTADIYPCDSFFDNSAGLANTDLDSVKINGRHTNIVPMHILITPIPRVGAISKVRKNSTMEQLAEIIANMASKVENMDSYMENMESMYNKLNEMYEMLNGMMEKYAEMHNEGTDEVSEAPETEAVENSSEGEEEAAETESVENSSEESEALDLEGLADLVVKKLKVNAASAPESPKGHSSIAQMMHEKRWA